jgi:hypothetical protein
MNSVFEQRGFKHGLLRAGLTMVRAGIALTMLHMPAEAQTLGQGAMDDVSPWRVVAALLLCLMLAVAGAFALKARGGRVSFFPLATKRRRRLELIESLRLGQAELCLVMCDGREMLVLASSQGGSLIAELASEKFNGAGPDESSR